MTATPKVPGARNITGANLASNMIVPLATSGPQVAQTTVGAIAALAANTLDPTVTTITTVGAGLLTAAAIVGGVIVRSGSVAAYSDTTDTAVAIIAALPTGAQVGTAWKLEIKNLTAFSETLVAGVGVTLSGNKDVIPPNSVGSYLVTYVSASSVTIFGISVTSLTNGIPEQTTALSTVGAGTITAAGIAGSITTRSGSQSNTAFTDTTATADLIIAAIPNARIGQSFEWTYQNNTNATATLTGGVGVTVSGITAVPANCTAKYLVTYTAASTITIVGVSRTIPSTTSGTFTCNGVTPVTVADTNVTANSNIVVTLKTVGGTVGATPAVKTITAGTGFTIAGTASDTSVYNYLIIN